MHLRFVFLPCLCCLALLTMQALCGEPPTAKTREAPRADGPQRTDRYGDPLPLGVVARLGTERLKLVWARFLTFSPDGRRLAAHSATQELRIWDVPSGKVLLRLSTPRSSGITGKNPLVFSPDGKAIALAISGELQRAGKPQATVRIWEVATGKELHFFGGLKGSEFNLAFSPDGRYLFRGGSQAPLLRLDLTKRGAPKEYGSFSAVEFLAVSRDGKTLTAVIHDRSDWPKRTFVCWDTTTGKEIGRHTLTTAGAYAGRLSHDGGLYAAPAVGGKSIALLDPLTGRERGQIRESDSPDLISISADGATMTSASWEGSIRVWEIATGKLRTHFKTLSSPKVEWTALSPDGKWLALTGRTDGVVHLWDVAAGRELHSFGHPKGPLVIAFLKDGKEIVTVNREGRPSARVPIGGRDGRPIERNITE